jgi:hypothetical protein
MPEFLKTAFVDGPAISPVEVMERLAIALLLGFAVAGIYRFARRGAVISPTFSFTLVLLSLLIAMVTQVIGDNVARAFSLVGALSIVRFRTVVRDTQDTAYVIFAVIVGMAVGAKNPWVAVIGLAIVGVTVVAMSSRHGFLTSPSPHFVLRLRVGLGVDLEGLVKSPLDQNTTERELMAAGTAKQGQALEVIYQLRLKPGIKADAFIKTLTHIEGVLSAQLERRGFDDD